MLYLTSPTFTRPANITAYASGQLVANSTTAGSVVLPTFDLPNNGFAFRLDRVMLRKSGTSTTSAQFRVHFYSALPTVANGDGGTFSTSGVASYLGYADVSTDVAFTDGAAGFSAFTQHDFVMPMLTTPNKTLYAAIEARAAYTPANAETFSITLMCTDSL